MTTHYVAFVAVLAWTGGLLFGLSVMAIVAARRAESLRFELREARRDLAYAVGHPSAQGNVLPLQRASRWL